MFRVFLVAALTTLTASAQTAKKRQALPFTTNSTTYVDVPGTELTEDLPGAEVGLLLWRATMTGTASGSVIVTQTDGGSRWGFGQFSGSPSGPTPFLAADFQVGQRVELVTRARTDLPGGTITITDAESVVIRLGTAPPIRTQERFDLVQVADDGWTTVLSEPSPPATPMLVVAYANVSADDEGVSLRVIATPSNAVISGAVQPSATLVRGRTYFFLGHVSSSLLGQTIRVEALAAPGRFDGGAHGLSAELSDARLLLATLGSAVSCARSMGMAAAGVRTMVASCSRPANEPAVLAFTTMRSTGPGPFTTELSFAGTTQLATWPGGLEVPLIAGWGVSPLDGGLDLAAWLTTPNQATYGDVQLSSIGLSSLIIEGPDAGVLDGGIRDAGTVDAGAFDAGPLDAGAFDAGPLDAGTVDAGAFDAGTVDAGAVDAGPLDAGVDAGTADAGVSAERRRFFVGCGASAVPLEGLLALVLLAWRRR